MAKRKNQNSEESENIVISDPGSSDVSYFNAKDFLKFANLSRIQIWDPTSRTSNTSTFTKYTKSQIVSYLSNPSTNEVNLRNMSIYLYNISNYYRRLILYFANMPTFAYVISPWKLSLQKAQNKSTIYKGYQNAANQLSIMNIPHEFRKILKVAFREDIFYGYTYETKDSFSIQKLNPDYCKITSCEDGVFNFAFNFSYFDSNADELPNYDPDFEVMYNQYKSGGSSYQWQELSSKRSICIKINEDSVIPIPPFVSLFSALADIEDYRAITKNASETSNYKMLSLMIPTDKDGNFLIDYEMAKDFYIQMSNVLPENIGAILTPMKIDSVDFEKSGAMSDTDLVTGAESSFWSEAGVNKLLFGGGEDPSSTSLGLSTISDQAIVFSVLEQIQRWINRKLKQLSGTVKFQIQFLDITRYNQKEVHDQLVKDGQYGLPVRNAIMAASGFQQPNVLSMAYLENEILNMSSYEKPLISSNTQTSEESVGRPTAEELGVPITDEGENSREKI